jgi:hypothetical protein
MQRRPYLTTLICVLFLRTPLTHTQGPDGVEMNPRLFTPSHSPHTVPPGENRYTQLHTHGLINYKDTKP